jgi:hypothetical protein
MGSCCSGQDRVEPTNETEVEQDHYTFGTIPQTQSDANFRQTGETDFLGSYIAGFSYMNYCFVP